MRLDKFLKNARLIKRRTIAKEACESGNVTVNGKVAKPGLEIKEGDYIVISFGNREVRGTVEEIIENPKKSDADRMFKYDSQ